MNTLLPIETTTLLSGLRVRTAVKAGEQPLCVQAQRRWGREARTQCESCLDAGANYDLEGNYCWMVL